MTQLLLLLVASCAQPGGGVGDATDPMLGEEASAELFAAPSCDGARICTTSPARAQCLAAGQEGSFAYDAVQTFNVPTTAPYSFARLGLRRLFAGDDATLRVRLVELAATASPIDDATTLATATLPGAAIARTNGHVTVRFPAAVTLSASTGAAKYGLVVDVPVGRMTVGIACASEVNAVESGQGGQRKRRRVDGGGFPATAWRLAVRDMSLALGHSAVLAGPCQSTVGAACDDGNAVSGDGCSASCQVEAGFTCSRESGTCTDVDECASAGACASGFACTNTPGSFACADVNECANPSACGAGFTCTNSAGSFSCTDTDECAAPGACPSGYTCANASGSFACNDIDECASPGACAAGFTCANTAGSFACADVNECANPSACAAGYACTNTPGSFTCADVNECASPSACGAGYACTNTPGSFTCADVNECANPSACTTGYACVNTAGSYNCNDVNECVLGTHDCSANATCGNTVGGFSCTCVAGYSGNGVTCVPDLVASGTYVSRTLADADGLRSYFRLDEPACCQLVDSMSRGSGWVFGGSPGTGKVGGGWSRGAGATNGFRLDVPGTDLTTFSVSFWWKPTDMTIHAANDGAGILWMSPDSAERIIGMNGLPSANRLRWGYFPNSSSMDGGATLVQNAWHHVVITQTGPNTAKLYLNGTPVATSSTYAFRVLDRLYLNHYYEQTGGNTNSHYGRGIIDELAIWNRVLSATEVGALNTAQAAGTALFPQPVESSLYANQAAAVSGGVKAYFRFDEASGTTLTDSMGAYSGVVLGGNATTGKLGGAWARGATASHGFRLDLAGLNLTTYTLSFWWKPSDMTYYAAGDGAGIVWMKNDSAASVIGMNGLVNTNRLRWGTFPNASSMDGNFTLIQDSWHHIAITVSGGTASALYVNGVQRATSAAYSFALGPTMYLANYTVLGNTNPHYGRGAFDELVVWNRALSAGEVLSVATKGLQGRPLFP